MGKDERSGSANALTNPRHEAFCQRMALGDNQTEAAKLAGYATSCASVQGHKLMQKPLIQQRVQYLRNLTSDVAIERVALNKSWVLQNLKTVVERAMQAIPVTDAQGNKIGQYKFG
ncbi:MAG: terminase small subunit [Acidobacteria bacterium]|nr:terminase small subunit [Acidobacteriota bacterium]